jgi:hypothetical protein
MVTPLSLPSKCLRGRQLPRALGGLGWQTPLISEEPEILVGKAGFEPATSASRTLRAAKLRHFPSAGAGYSSAPPCLVIVAAGARMTTLATLLRSIFEMRRVHPAKSS